jgi:hypothetical protein
LDSTLHQQSIVLVVPEQWVEDFRKLGSIEETHERFASMRMLELLDGFAFDLTDSFASDLKDLADLLECVSIPVG